MHAPTPRAEEATVLVVDDDAHNRDVLEQELELLGCRPMTAASGQEALALMREAPVDLVLLDVMMPGMDGFAVLAELKADPQWRRVPVVMISALHELASIVRAIALGADDYLPKPFDPVLLKARVGAGLERKRWQDQEAAYRAQIERQLQDIAAERARADGLLEAILPAAAIPELKGSGRLTPRRHERVAILFADIVGFTAYSERRDAADVVRKLDGLMRTFEEIIAAHGLEKIKSIGDGVAATANLLTRRDDPAYAAVTCAHALVKAARSGPAGWALRVGVALGPVVSGIVGGSKFAFDVWGDVVNTAARLSGIGTEAGVFVTEPVWTDLAGRYRGHVLEGLHLRGKEGLAVWRCYRDS
jgi:CheY-like chemotaxis protein